MSELSRHDKMVKTAVWLAKQGAFVGWGDAHQGKAIKHRWKSDMTDDPALVEKMLGGSKNALIIPAGRLFVIDLDKPGWFQQLVDAGLPPTYTVVTPSKRVGPDKQPYTSLHCYLLLPEGVVPGDLPSVFAGGEVRRSDNGEQGMVLGPWSMRRDGIYTPTASRSIAVAPQSVIDFLISHRAQAGAGNGGTKANGTWQWTDEGEGSRHEHLKSVISGLRRGRPEDPDGVERIVWEYIERHGIPLEREGDEPDIDRKEVRALIDWAYANLDDDTPKRRREWDERKAGAGNGSQAQPGLSNEDDEELASGDRERILAKLPVDIHGAAFGHMVGRIARAMSGYTTEASATGILSITLVAVGALIGRRRYLRVGPLVMHPRPWVMLVGTSSRGRKGTAYEVVDTALSYRRAAAHGLTVESVVPEWEAVGAVLRSLNSAEGATQRLLAAATNDEVSAMLFEGEFGSVAKRAGRDGSTLSPWLRDMYDGKPAVRTVANPKDSGMVRRTHICLATSVTPPDLIELTTQADKDSGFLNRFLMLGVEGVLIDGLPVPDDSLLELLAGLVRATLDWVSASGDASVTLSDAALELYTRWRRALFERESRGAVGAMENRAESHVLRLALVLATLDQRVVIERVDLLAGLALWDLHERTVRSVWASMPLQGDHRRVWNRVAAEGEAGMAAFDVKRRMFSRNRVFVGDAVIDDLVRDGWLRPVRLTRTSRPRYVAVEQVQAGVTARFLKEEPPEGDETSGSTGTPQAESMRKSSSTHTQTHTNTGVSSTPLTPSFCVCIQGMSTSCSGACGIERPEPVERADVPPSRVAEPTPTSHVRCADYQAHRFDFVYRAGRWLCLRCEAKMPDDGERWTDPVHRLN